MELRPSLFCLFFCLLYFFLPPFKELGCFSGCLMSSAGIQKLFCGIYSKFKCSFDEFVGEKVFSPSYSSAILAPPPTPVYFHIPVEITSAKINIMPSLNLPAMQIGFDPWVGKIPWRRKWQPTPVFLPGESHGQRSLVGYSPWGPRESDTTEVT